MISQAATLWIRDPKVSIERLKTTLAQEHDRGLPITFFNRRDLTVVHINLGEEDPEVFHERAQSLAEELEREVYCLSAFTGSASGNACSAFDASGRELWSDASPERASAESRRIEKALGVHFITSAQLERLEDRDEDLADDATRLKDLPYWKLHLALALPGKDPLVDLTTKPALETSGSGWKKVEYWATPEEAQKAAVRATSAGLLRPKIEAALKKLAHRAGKEKVTVFHVDWSSGIKLSIGTEQSQTRALKKLKAQSILLRKSPLAQKAALRGHPSSFITEVVKTDEGWVDGAIDAAMVQRSFGPNIEGAGFHGELSDPIANAWNSLIELSNAEVVQVLAEIHHEEMRSIFRSKLHDQVREYLQTDLVVFAPLLADALLKDPENSALVDFSWVLLEPAVKKLSKNTKYRKTLEKLFAVTKAPRYLKALQRIGAPLPKQ